VRRIGWAAYPTMHRRGVGQRNMTRGWLSGLRKRLGRNKFKSSRNSGWMMKRPQKITLGEMRAMGIRGLLIYCSD
jgi:hypothetical protein